MAPELFWSHFYIAIFVCSTIISTISALSAISAVMLPSGGLCISVYFIVLFHDYFMKYWFVEIQDYGLKCYCLFIYNCLM